MPNAFDLMVPPPSTETAADKAAAEDRELFANAALVTHFVNVLSSHVADGDLFGLVRRFEETKLSGKFQSWIGGGENLPITAREVELVLGSEILGKLQEKLQLAPNQPIDERTLADIGTVLPVMVRKFTRSGQIPPARILARSVKELEKELAARA